MIRFNPCFERRCSSSLQIRGDYHPGFPPTPPVRDRSGPAIAEWQDLVRSARLDCNAHAVKQERRLAVLDQVRPSHVAERGPDHVRGRRERCIIAGRKKGRSAAPSSAWTRASRVNVCSSPSERIASTSSNSSLMRCGRFLRRIRDHLFETKIDEVRPLHPGCARYPCRRKLNCEASSFHLLKAYRKRSSSTLAW